MATASSGSSMESVAAGNSSRRCSRRFFFVSLVVSRALQDLYEDWSAIYRNRIPPYLTLPPLARFSPGLPCASPTHLPLLPHPFPPFSPCTFFPLVPSLSSSPLLFSLLPRKLFPSSSLISSLFVPLFSPSLFLFFLLLRAVFSIPYSAIIVKIVVLKSRFNYFRYYEENFIVFY